MVTVLISGPGDYLRRVELGDGVHRIGRSSSNTISLPLLDISRHHAEIVVRGERVVVRDLASKHGTWVKGERVQEHELAPGDVVRCGSAHILLERDREAAAGKAPAPSILLTATDSLAHASLEQLLVHSRPSEAKAPAPAEAPGVAESRLLLLLKVGRLLSEPLEIDVLLERILDVLGKMLPIDRAAVVMMDPVSGALEPRVVRGVTRGQKPYSSTAVRWACTQKTAALFADAGSHQVLGQAHSVIDVAVRSSMCAPLLVGDRVLGALYVDSFVASRRFAEQDLELLASFAGQAAVAIDNSMLQARLQEEAVLRNTMTRFFPPATVRRLREARDAGFATIETEVTALFADITDFTGLSARMEPREVVEMLNDYFPMMVEIVFRHEGTLEKYIGDALMAVWGAPLSRADDADRAVRAALEMREAVARLNARLQAEGKAPIGIHVGLNTGRVAAGNIGSDEYVQYATIGDAINVASRICNAAGDGEILISETTRSRLSAAPCDIESLGPVALKGKAQPVELHRLEPRGVDATR